MCAPILRPQGHGVNGYSPNTPLVSWESESEHWTRFYDYRRWLGLCDGCRCPIHDLPLFVQADGDSGGLVWYACSKCKPAELARSLGHYWVAGFFDRLPNPVRYASDGFTSECPSCGSRLWITIQMLGFDQPFQL